MATGKVYLVGAGPGSPDLLTIRAAALLGDADVIVHDRLIHPDILALGRPDAERIDMGKPVGNHQSRQDEINDLLVRLARDAKVVVRLKGGDPFVFGRGGEEAEYLAARGVPFEVVPGVSASLAAPLSAGIAVTHRSTAASVTIVTGHECDGKSRIDWAALARLDTLVFLMAVHNAGAIASRLIAHGRGPDTPAAMIQMAFWPGERVVTGTLRTIADDIRAAGIEPPATLVVGEVVLLHHKLKAVAALSTNDPRLTTRPTTNDQRPTTRPTTNNEQPTTNNYLRALASSHELTDRKGKPASERLGDSGE